MDLNTVNRYTYLMLLIIINSLFAVRACMCACACVRACACNWELQIIGARRTRYLSRITFYYPWNDFVVRRNLMKQMRQVCRLKTHDYK